MAGETVITMIGNLTADPELRFLANGAAVTNFTLASTPRTFDRQTQEWKDGDPLFIRCSAWKQLAENAAESLARGTGVIVQGRLRQRSYETKEGEKRTIVELEVDEIGPSLKWATAAVTKVTSGGQGGQRGGGQQGGGYGGRQAQGGGYGQQTQPRGGQQQDDPWATPAGGNGGQQGGGWGPPPGGYSDEPPF